MWMILIAPQTTHSLLKRSTRRRAVRRRTCPAGMGGLRAISGVEAALIAMATDLNLGLLAELGFGKPPQAGPNDLLIAVRAKDDAALAGQCRPRVTGVPDRRRPGGRTSGRHGLWGQQGPRLWHSLRRPRGPGGRRAWRLTLLPTAVVSGDEPTCPHGRLWAATA